MAELKIERLTKSFGNVRAIDDIHLHVREGEFVTLLGPSGCGKSTTLGAIAGLERPTGGRIAVGGLTYFDGERGVFLQPEARNCGLVFQSYALWPHMTVFQNVAFPLTLRKLSDADKKKRVAEVLGLVEMEPYADRYPHQLSGGQQQRVALARTLSYRPHILLLDEPLSNLDAKLRDRARNWLGELRTRLHITTIYVTHDQVEALSLSDRVVVMNGGRVSQIGTPREIYETPADPFVADFIGTTNFLRGTVSDAVRSDGLATVTLPDGQQLDVSAASLPARHTAVTLAYRPEQIRVVAPGAAVDREGSVLHAQVTGRAYVGGRWQISLLAADNPMRLELEDAPSAEALQVWLPHRGAIAYASEAPASAGLLAAA